MPKLNRRAAVGTVISLAAGATLAFASVPLWASGSGTTSIQESDAEIEARTRPVTEQIVAIMGATEDADMSAVYDLVIQRGEICAELLVEPEGEHSNYVQDTCGTQIQEALKQSG